MKKIFGEVKLTWKKVILLAIIAGIYTAVMAILPITKNTSFRNISVYLEAWILFGIFIIMNSESPKDSALKCFVFFLISQPLVYLIQVPFSSLGIKIFIYYKYWFMWTLLTIPMGFIGYYMKKDKWWGLLILVPIMIVLGLDYGKYLGETLYNFPYQLLSCLFCGITLFLYPILIFNDKRIKVAGATIGVIILIIMTGYSLSHRTVYTTTALISHGSAGAVFDDTYNVYLEDPSFGTVNIKYEEGLEDYAVDAKFNKAGKTNLILENKNGTKEVYELEIKRDDFIIKKR